MFRLQRLAKTAVLALSVVAVLASESVAKQPPTASQDQAKACAVAAKTDYIKENLALLNQGTPLLSVEGTITQRRLEEQYCLRFVRCFYGDPNDLAFKAEFNSCLEDESLEKYEAVPRSD
jgi:hypothetical protein